MAGNENNGIARLKNVNLSGKKSILMQFAIYIPGGTWTIKIDKPTGNNIAQLLLKQLKTTQSWTQIEIPVESTQGAHDLYFLYQNPGLKDPNQQGISFHWFYFYEGFCRK